MNDFFFRSQTLTVLISVLIHVSWSIFRYFRSQTSFWSSYIIHVFRVNVNWPKHMGMAGNCDNTINLLSYWLMTSDNEQLLLVVMSRLWTSLWWFLESICKSTVENTDKRDCDFDSWVTCGLSANWEWSIKMNHRRFLVNF